MPRAGCATATSPRRTGGSWRPSACRTAPPPPSPPGGIWWSRWPPPPRASRPIASPGRRTGRRRPDGPGPWPRRAPGRRRAPTLPGPTATATGQRAATMSARAGSRPCATNGIAAGTRWTAAGTSPSACRDADGRAPAKGESSGKVDGRQGLEGGLGEQVALAQGHPLGPTNLKLLEGFHPLGDHPDVHLLRHLDNAADDGATPRVAVDVADEAHIQLDQVGLEVRQHAEPGVAGAKVVDGGVKAPLPVVLDDLPQVRVVRHLPPLGELENDAIEGEAVAIRRLQGGANAQLRAVHGVGHEIDAEQALHAEPRRELDSLDPAGLVEQVAVVLVDVLEHPAGGLAVDAPHQGFVGKDLAPRHIDDGLEGHGDVKAEPAALEAFGTAEGPVVFLFLHGG